MSWWRDAVVYAIDVRAFGDAATDTDLGTDGRDGLDGVRSRLGYVELLGVDAVSLGPSAACTPADDVPDDDGREADADPGGLGRLLDRARAAGLRVLVDLSPGHVAIDHHWFRAAADSPSGSAERERLHVRRGRGPGGHEPPSNWGCRTGDPAWSPLDGSEWFLHLGGPELPDLNWGNPEVWAETEKLVRAWCERGVDGLRIEAPHATFARTRVPDDPRPHRRDPLAGPDDPRYDGDGVHDVHRMIRAVLDHYPGRIGLADVEVADPARFARYGRPDELHLAVQQGLRHCGFRARHIRGVVDASLAATRAAGAVPAWTLGGPDDPRPATRHGGRARAKAMAMLLLALPGAAVLRAGDELCLPGPAPTRPGAPCRPPSWAGAAEQIEDPTSALSLHRHAIELRRSHPGFADAAGEDRLEWFGAPEGCLAFRRVGSTLVCALNTSATPVPLPPGEMVLASGPTPNGELPPDTAAWLA